MCLAFTQPRYFLYLPQNGEATGKKVLSGTLTTRSKLFKIIYKWANAPKWLIIEFLQEIIEFGYVTLENFNLISVILPNAE